MIRMADSEYHTLRVAMNWMLVFLWKNSTESVLVFRRSADRELRDLALAAIQQRQQRARAHQRREHRGEDAERQHDREALDRAGAEHEQHHARDERGDVG